MRRSEKQVKQPEAIMKILTAGTVCQLAFSAQPVPYLLTLNYAYYNGALYFHSANEGRKIDFLSQQSQAAYRLDIEHMTAKQSKIDE